MTTTKCQDPGSKSYPTLKNEQTTQQPFSNNPNQPMWLLERGKGFSELQWFLASYVMTILTS